MSLRNTLNISLFAFIAIANQGNAELVPQSEQALRNSALSAFSGVVQRNYERKDQKGIRHPLLRAALRA